MDDTPYLDFLSGYSVFNIGRNHPVVKKVIRDVLDLDLPNMVQMDCSLLSGLLAEAVTKRTPPHLDAVFFCNSGTEAIEGALKFARAATQRKRVISLESAFHGLSLGSLSLMGCESFTEGFGPLMEGFETRVSLDDIRTLERELSKGDVAAFVIEPVQGRAASRRRPIFSTRLKRSVENMERWRSGMKPDRSPADGKEVGVGPWELGTGHHHAREELEWRLRPMRCDCHAA